MDDASPDIPAPSRDDGASRGFDVVCLVGAAVTLGLAINTRDGEYWPEALRLVGIGVVSCCVGTLWRRRREGTFGADWVALAGASAVVVQAFAVFLSPPGGRFYWSDDLVPAPPGGRIVYYAGAALAYGAAALLAVSHARPARAPRFLVPLVLLLHVFVGVWLIRFAAPAPAIDVHVFQQDASKALLQGHNPYAMTFGDMYRSADPGERPVYGEGLVRDGTLTFGFPYPPLSLYLAAGGYLLGGDHRYAQLLAMTAAGALIAYARPGAWSSLVAVLFLFAPRAFFVLGRGWTEPFVVLCLAAAVFCACRNHRRLLPVALGLMLATKQYTLLVVPLVPLLMQPPWRWRDLFALVAKAAGVAAAVTAPLALWDPEAFWHSLVTVQKVAPFREDALSYLVWFHQRTGTRLGVLPAFAAAGVAIALALWRAERSPTGFAGAVAWTYVIFIALNKQAFANYYHFVIGALWCAVAAAPVRGVAGPPALAGAVLQSPAPAKAPGPA